MKKVIIGLVIVAFFALGIVGVLNQPNKIERQIKDEDYREITAVDYEKDYPDNPTDVVKAYGDIDELIYSFKFEGKREPRLEELIRKQMQLLDKEFVEFNGGSDKVLLSKMNGAKEMLESGNKVIDVKYQTNPSQTLDNDGNIVKFVNVIYYMKGDNVYRSYAIRKNFEGRWKIFTYQDIDPFTIS